MSFVATIGSASANSYATVLQADAYFAYHPLEATWFGLSNPQKETALVTATRNIDRLRFWGCVATRTQALKFPRLYRRLWVAGQLPKELLEAVYEEALAISPQVVSGCQTQREKLRAAGVTSYSIGDLSESFAASSASVAVAAEHNLCERAQIMLRGFVSKVGQIETDRNRLECCDPLSSYD